MYIVSQQKNLKTSLIKKKIFYLKKKKLKYILLSALPGI